jgi:hypothetical protein
VDSRFGFHMQEHNLGFTEQGAQGLRIADAVPGIKALVEVWPFRSDGIPERRRRLQKT